MVRYGRHLGKSVGLDIPEHRLTCQRNSNFKKNRSMHVLGFQPQLYFIPALFKTYQSLLVIHFPFLVIYFLDNLSHICFRFLNFLIFYVLQKYFQAHLVVFGVFHMVRFTPSAGRMMWVSNTKCSVACEISFGRFNFDFYDVKCLYLS